MTRRRLTLLIATAALAAMSSLARAQSASDDQESPAHSLARALGLAAPEPKVEDFVRDSRPAEPGQAIPVFSTPPEPDSQVRSTDSLNAMDSELDETAKTNQKLLADRTASLLPPKPAPTKPKPKPKKTPAPVKPDN